MNVGTINLVAAPELAPGDSLLNLGKVVKTEPVGAFIVVLVQGDRWSLATGTRVTSQWDLVLHVTEALAVRVGS